eukprot:GHVP01013720.1.p1 GENE.GHVP01013720.1~~GHVP01013720.1.p1  ORF type:complete len:1126 (+),score=191.61 GHVP01013720.1:1638-5015(+)
MSLDARSVPVLDLSVLLGERVTGPPYIQCLSHTLNHNYVQLDPKGEVLGSQRQGETTLLLPSQEVSPEHTAIRPHLMSGNYQIIDLGSKKGTWVHLRQERPLSLPAFPWPEGGLILAVNSVFFRLKSGRQMSETEALTEFLRYHELLSFQNEILNALPDYKRLEDFSNIKPILHGHSPSSLESQSGGRIPVTVYSTRTYYLLLSALANLTDFIPVKIKGRILDLYGPDNKKLQSITWSGCHAMSARRVAPAEAPNLNLSESMTTCSFSALPRSQTVHLMSELENLENPFNIPTNNFLNCIDNNVDPDPPPLLLSASTTQNSKSEKSEKPETPEKDAPKIVRIDFEKLSSYGQTEHNHNLVPVMQPAGDDMDILLSDESDNSEDDYDTERSGMKYSLLETLPSFSNKSTVIPEPMLPTPRESPTPSPRDADDTNDDESDRGSEVSVSSASFSNSSTSSSSSFELEDKSSEASSVTSSEDSPKLSPASVSIKSTDDITKLELDLQPLISDTTPQRHHSISTSVASVAPENDLCSLAQNMPATFYSSFAPSFRNGISARFVDKDPDGDAEEIFRSKSYEEEKYFGLPPDDATSENGEDIPTVPSEFNNLDEWDILDRVKNDLDEKVNKDRRLGKDFWKHVREFDGEEQRPPITRDALDSLFCQTVIKFMKTPGNQIPFPNITKSNPLASVIPLTFLKFPLGNCHHSFGAYRELCPYSPFKFEEPKTTEGIVRTSRRFLCRPKLVVKTKRTVSGDKNRKERPFFRFNREVVRDLHFMIDFFDGRYRVLLLHPDTTDISVEDPPKAVCRYLIPQHEPRELLPGDVFSVGNVVFRCMRKMFGTSECKGHRKVMEDKICVVTDMVLASDMSISAEYFGLFDGHGGVNCSLFCQEELHRAFQQSIFCRTNGGLDVAIAENSSSENLGSQKRHFDFSALISDCMKQAFVLTDLAFLRNRINANEAISPGAAAVCLVMIGGYLWCAACGDSRAVLCRDKKALALTDDHRPDRDDENKRILGAGGYVKGRRVLGRLAVSRSFGDMEYKNIGTKKSPYVCVDPSIVMERIQQKDEFVVLACDGLYDFCTNQEVVDFVRLNLQTCDVHTTAQHLVRYAIDTKKSRDNVSVIIVLLNQK